MHIFKALEIDISVQEFDAIFNQFDKDNNGSFNFEEFYPFIYVIQNCNFEQEASTLFYINDTDRNGTMDKKEMIRMLDKLGCTLDLDTEKLLFSYMAVKKQITYKKIPHLI